MNAENLDTASERFVANLYPTVSSLLDAHRTYFDRVFIQPAREAGFKIHADTSVRPMHYGNYGYSREDAGMELQRYRTFHFHTK